MESELNLIVNGKSRAIRVDQPTSLAKVLTALSLKADRIAVEHNGQIARRTAWETIMVEDGAKLEIVHFVGGGCGLLH